MDNHPIPQDVTGFQFKLIGNMTIKQFAYLAVGIIIAWLFFQLPITLFIKIPVSGFFALLGIGLAYIPIGGRPMDVMIGNFIKALFRPTQFIYDKSGTEIFQNQITFEPKNSTPPIAQPTPSPIGTNIPPVSPLPSPLPLQTQIAPSLPEEKPAPIAPEPTPVQIPNPPKPPEPTKPEVKTARTFPPRFNRGNDVPATPLAPNIIVGSTKDPRDNPLPNILVEIKDKEGNPVRAFKTNEAGRFASATPLQNGTYTIHFEDPKAQNKFETKTVNVANVIIQPVVVTSIDTREELRRQLFNS